MSIVTAVGQDVTLNCTVNGSPQPTKRWLRHNNLPLVLGNYDVLISTRLFLLLHD